MDKNKDFLHDLWYVSGVNEDIWSTLMDNYNNATTKEEKDNALEHIKWHLGYKQDDGKLKEIEKKIENSTQVKLTFTANADTTIPVYYTKESFVAKQPDETISLTANQEKTTIYDRESIYKFIIPIVENHGNPWDPKYKTCIISVKIDGALLDCSNLFKECLALTSLDVTNFDTSKVTDMSNMFNNCSSLTTLDVTNFDTSNVTNMSYMFSNCSALTSLDVTNFDTSKVTGMDSMFKRCSALTTLDFSHFNTSNVTNMMEMFEGCIGLTILNVTNFDTSKVTDMARMFNECSSLTTLDVSNWNTSNVTNMNGMFSGCSKLTTFDVTNWNTSNVTNMSYMFSNCSALTSLDVTNWNTSNVTNINGMFQDCSNLNTIGSVNTALGWQHKPDEYYHMFNNCPATPKPSWYTE